MKKKYILLIFIFFTQLQLVSAQTVGLFLNDSTAYNGYTLFAPGVSHNTYLIDNCGRVVNEWEASETNPGVSVYLLENGNLLRTGRISSSFNGGGSGGRLEMFNWEDDLLWRYDYTSTLFHQHHDVAYLPNGNILLIAWELHIESEVIAAGRNTDNVGGVVWSERVVEIKPIGNDDAEIVWVWRLWDHLVQDFDATKENFEVVADHPELMNINFGVSSTGSNKDWVHFNSINYNPDLDQIILSSRHLNEVYIIDHSTTSAEAASHSGGNSGKGGDFLFRWGNPQSYDRGLPEDQKFYRQHDARWIPAGYPDEGKIMVFNNGVNRPEGNYSTVDIINPPLDNNNTYTISANEPFAPDELFWTYVDDIPTHLFSHNISGAHPLPNGNTLICEGRKGNFYEVANDGTLTWHYKMPIGNNGPVIQGQILTNAAVFRATRYGADYSAFVGKDLTPGAPIELNPLPSDCEIFEEPVAVSTLSNLEGVSILENPFRDFIFIKNQTGETVIIEIFDLLGKKVAHQISSNEDIQLATQNWNNGFYIIRISNVQKNRFFVSKLLKTADG